MSDSSAAVIKASRPRRNKYHRRGLRACDECRLRKRKCNGLEPCSACIATTQACSYESRKSALPPTQKIRWLEDELRTLRNTIDDLKSAHNSTNDIEPNLLRQTLESATAPEASAEHADSFPSKEGSLGNMLAGTGYLLKCSQRSEKFFGPSSGVSLVCKMLELFLTDSDIVPSTSNIHSALLDLYDRPMPEKLKLYALRGQSFELPQKTEMLQVIEHVFAQYSLVAQSLQYTDVCQSVNSLYQHGEFCNEQDTALLHSLLAVGYLCYEPEHRMRGCRSMIDKALLHFSAARRLLDITQCNNLSSLQSLLCIIVFLLSTCRIVAAHPYIGAAYSSAMRLGLHCRSFESLHLPSAQRRVRRRIFTNILILDLYCSLVLGLPPFGNLHELHRDLESSRNETSYEPNVSNECEKSDAIAWDLSMKHLDLLRITSSGLSSVFPCLDVAKGGKYAAYQLSVNKHNLDEVRNQLHQWAGTFSALIKRAGSCPDQTFLKKELEIMYYFCQIVLYQPFLHYLKKMANRESLSRSQSKEALACIKVASIIISRSEQMMKQSLMSPASWVSIYSIFLSVVCLMFLVAAHSGTSRPSEAWRKARRGIELLVAAKCRDGCASACLDVLKKLSAELSHTVDFDFEQIETSTARVCQHALVYDEIVNEDRSALLSDELQTPQSNSAETAIPHRESPVTFGTQSWRRDDPTTQMNVDSDGVSSVSFPCDADEILAQAHGISLGHRIDLFFDLEEPAR